jgi:transposase
MAKSIKDETPRRKYRRFSAEFKAEALRLLEQRLAQDMTAADVARELGIGPGLLTVWAQRARAAGEAQSTRGETLEEEVRRLRRENATLREERAFAKKAAAFFAMESR